MTYIALVCSFEDLSHFIISRNFLCITKKFESIIIWRSSSRDFNHIVSTRFVNNKLVNAARSTLILQRMCWVTFVFYDIKSLRMSNVINESAMNTINSCYQLVRRLIKNIKQLVICCVIKRISLKITSDMVDVEFQISFAC